MDEIDEMNETNDINKIDEINEMDEIKWTNEWISINKKYEYLNSKKIISILLLQSDYSANFIFCANIKFRTREISVGRLTRYNFFFVFFGFYIKK